MANIEVKEFKIKLSGTEYTFRLDFRALLRFTARYVDALDIFNKFLSGQGIYDCIIKILSCACVEKHWTEDELARELAFNFATMKLFDDITFALTEGLLQEREPGEAEKN